MLDLNNTLVTIRERTLPEICDLSLQVLRRQFRPIMIAAVVGIAPWMILNWFLLSYVSQDLDNQWFHYFVTMLCLVYWQQPLATGLVTIVLGQAMFQRRLDFRRAWSDYVESLPQLIWHQFVWRFFFFPHGVLLLLFAANEGVYGWLTFWSLFWIYPAVRWTYLSEVILLERNPWRAKVGQLSTRQRNSALHSGEGGTIFGRRLALWGIELFFIFAVFSGIWFLRGQLSEALVMDRAMFVYALPISIWAATLFVSVVRFFCYLDLRICREGWEVDLVLRAEAEKLLKPGGEKSGTINSGNIQPVG